MIGKWFKNTTEIFPFYLLAIIFYPMLLGVFIDYELFDSRYVLINLVWIPLFTIPFYFFNKKIIYQLTVGLYFLIGLLEVTHWILLKGPITLTSLLVISHTNYQETVDFLAIKSIVGLLLLLPYAMLFIIAFKKVPQVNPSRNKLYFIIVVSFISFSFITENVINERFVRKAVPQVAKVSFTFFEKIQLYKEALVNPKPKEVEASLSSNQPQTFVLILGESCSRRHMSLYGAKRKTTPSLDKRDDIIVFNDAVSPYSNTIGSVLSVLTASNLRNGLEAEKSTDIIDVFHSAGFKTYWLSNQSPIGVWDNIVTVFAKKSDEYKFVNTTSNSSFEATLNTSLDEKLFAPFDKVLSDTASRKFIVLHLMGSHSSYKKRYPKKYDVFKGGDAKGELVAEYDNSVLYNDFVVDSLLTLLKLNTKNNTISAAIYLSDHGENVYDEHDKVGHDYAGQLPKVNVEIPFFTWVSSSYLKQCPEKVKAINLNKNTPFISDDLFHSIIDINAIKSPLFRPQNSIFNTVFEISDQRILEDGNDYNEN